MRTRELTRSGKWVSYAIPCHVPIRRFSELSSRFALMGRMRTWCSENLQEPFVVKWHSGNDIVCLVTNTLDLMRVMSEFPNE